MYFDFASEYLQTHPLRAPLAAAAAEEHRARAGDPRFVPGLAQTPLAQYLVLPETLLNSPDLALSGRLGASPSSLSHPHLDNRR